MKPVLKLLIILFFASTTGRALAALVSVHSTSELSPEGKVFWGDFGNGGTLVPAGSVANVKSVVDQSTLETMTIGSGAPNYNGPFVIYNVTASDSKGAWETGLSFSPGDRALIANWYDYNSSTQIINRPWEFTFSQPVSGFGTQGNTSIFGGGSMYITAYDVSDNVLGHFSIGVPGPKQDPSADGTAPFLGVLSNAANISRVEVDVSGGSGDNAINSPFVRLAPDANVVTLILGDFNRDAEVTNADLKAMLDALKNLSAYKQTYFLTEDDLTAIGDLNGFGGFEAGDIKPMMDLLAGNYSPPPHLVPEPASAWLAGVAALLTIAIRSKRSPINSETLD